MSRFGGKLQFSLMLDRKDKQAKERRYNSMMCGCEDAGLRRMARLEIHDTRKRAEEECAVRCMIAASPVGEMVKPLYDVDEHLAMRGHRPIMYERKLFSAPICFGSNFAVSLL